MSGQKGLVPALALSNIVNTSSAVNVSFEHIALGGDETWPGHVDRAIRRRATTRLGALAYAVIRTRTSNQGREPRTDLVRERIEQLALQAPGPRAQPVERAAHVRRRRLATWDAWAQAAMAAEDLEILIRALIAWRSRKDLFDELTRVGARGPGFFGPRGGSWTERLSNILRLPRSGDLTSCFSTPEAQLLETGLDMSVREASADLHALESTIPWDVREAMMRYKHGFTWIIPAATPLETDADGLRRVRASDEASFVVWTGYRSGIILTCSNEELAAALEATKLASGLEQFVCEAVLTECESKQGAWGLALYGESASDIAQRDLLDRATRWLGRR